MKKDAPTRDVRVPSYVDSTIHILRLCSLDTNRTAHGSEKKCAGERSVEGSGERRPEAEDSSTAPMRVTPNPQLKGVLQRKTSSHFGALHS